MIPLPEPDDPSTHGAPRPAPRRGGAVVTVAAGAVVVAGAYLLGRDGSPGWQVVRVLGGAGLAGAVLVVARAGGERRRSVVAFVAGCLAFAAGVGIALPHLAKGGDPPVTVAGTVLLVGGAVLVAAGGWILVRRTPRWWRVAVVPGLAAVLAVTLSVVGPPVAATNVPRTDLGATPADLGLSATEVQVVTADGVVLSAWLMPGADGAPAAEGAAVVLLHGAGSTRSSVLDQAAVLVGEGYGVLALDARGHGSSGGRAMDFGWYGDLDVAAAVDDLVDRPGVDAARIAVVGMSMGGEEAVGAAAADRRIAAVVAEGATSRTARDKSWLSERYGWRGRAQEGIEWLTYELADLLSDADQPTPLREAVAAAAPRPVLLIAGGGTTDEEHAGRHIQSGSPATVEVWVAPGSAHTAALDDHPEEWRRRVSRFLAESLGTG